MTTLTTDGRPKEPRTHQEKAIADAVAGLTGGGRGQVIMACGTGKTLVGQHVTAGLVGEGPARVLVLVPSLALLDQTIRHWEANTARPFMTVAVGSEETAGRGEAADTSGVHVDDLPVTVTTDPATLAGHLDQARGDVVVFATYHSSPVVASAHAVHGLAAWDVIVADEAHRMAGPTAGAFATALDDTKIPGNARLFMTATPRIHGETKQGERDLTLSMDDERLFGPVLHELSFAEAIDQGLLSDYRVVIVGVTRSEVLTRLTEDHTKQQAQEAATELAIARCVREYGIRSMLVFHNRISKSKRFRLNFPEALEEMPESERPPVPVRVSHVDGTTDPTQRRALLRELAHPDAAAVIVSNVRCLAEGVDVPALDGITIAAPRTSTVEVAQAVGRAIRKHPNTTNGSDGVATVLLPFFINDGENPETALIGSNFQHVYQTLTALADHDQRLVATFTTRPGTDGDAADDHGHSRTILASGQVTIWLPNQYTNLTDALRLRTLRRLTDPLETALEHLREFAAEHGHTRVPRQFVTGDGYKLGNKLDHLRRVYRAGRLKPDRVRELEALPGWSWNLLDEAWESALAHLREFAAEHGHTRVPERFVTGDGYKLGQKVGALRADARAGRLKPDRVRELEALPGWSWNLLDEAWESALAHLREFAAEHGHTRVPRQFVTGDGYKLGNKLDHLRRVYRAGRLKPDRVRELEALPGWSWNLLDEAWESALAHLREFAAEHGHTRVPERFITGDGYRLRSKVSNLRQAYRAGRLAPEQIRELEALPGWTWNLLDEAWESALAHLREFAAEHGHTHVPSRFITADGYKLGNKVINLRVVYRAGRLAPEQIRELEALPGWTWNPREQELDEAWTQAVKGLRAFAAEYGHAAVPQAFIDADGYKLGHKISGLRHAYRNGRLEPDRIRELETLPGWTWDAREQELSEAWATTIAGLQKFGARHGHARVPYAFVTTDGYKLGRKVVGLRSAYRAGRLAQERIDELETLPGWSWGRPMRGAAGSSGAGDPEQAADDEQDGT